MGVSSNQSATACWEYHKAKVRLIDRDEPLPTDWHYGNYALAEGLRLYGLLQPQWAWSTRSVPQVLLFRNTRFLLRSQMSEEHVECYAVFEGKPKTWRIQAGYQRLTQYSKKVVIYRL